MSEYIIHVISSTWKKYLGSWVYYFTTILPSMKKFVYHKTSTRLKLLKRVRHNLTTYAAERVYLNMIQPCNYCILSNSVSGSANVFERKTSISPGSRGKNVLSKQTDVEWKPISEIFNQKTLLDVHKAIQRVSLPGFHDFFKFLNHGKNT